MMKRHIAYYLAVAALLASGIAGAVATTIAEQPLHTAVFDLAGFKTRSGGTEVSIAYHGGPARSSNLVLAGFNSTKMGTEVSY